MSESLLEKASLPGLSVAISKNGQIVFAEGFGVADVQRQRLVSPRTRFRTASVAKMITITALARLVQEKRLDLDAPVQTYVPAFPRKQWPITSRQLTGHIAGLPNYSNEDRLEPRPYVSVLDSLSVFAHIPLRAEPLAEYRYSTHGFTLLSAVVEGAAGEPFLTYLDRAVFSPLGMIDSGPERRTASPSELAALYEQQGGRLTLVEHPEDVSYKWAAGGLVSTPSDLVRLARAYLGGFLNEDLVQTMWTSQRLANGQDTGVGIGWRVDHDAAGRVAIEHAGSMEGTRTVLTIFPAERLAVAIMANREWSSAIEETAHMLALPFLTAEPPPVPLTGHSEGVAELVSVSGQASRYPATLSLQQGQGELSIHTAASAVERYVLIGLPQRRTFALIRSDGIFSSTLSTDGKEWSLRVIGYGSPQGAPPANNPPFLTYQGTLVANH